MAKTPVPIPPRPFLPTDRFLQPDRVLVVIGTIKGRGRNREAKIARWLDGQREVRWMKVARLRRVLVNEKAQPFAGPWCRVCGCVENDCRACIKLTGRACAWTDEACTLCDACLLYRIPEARNLGMAAFSGGKQLHQNSHGDYVDYFGNELRDAWRAGWTAASAGVEEKNAQALKSLGAFTSAARRVFGGANG